MKSARLLQSTSTFIFTLLLGLSYGTLYAVADSSVSSGVQALLPPEIPELPKPGDQTNRLFVNSHNEELFRDVLLAPISRWLKNEKAVLRVFSHLNFEPSLGIDTSLVEKEVNSEKKALGILLNTIEALRKVDEIAYNISLSWISSTGTTRTSEGVLYRYFEKDPPILFHELFSLHSPSVVYGYRQVTTRYGDETEDAVWMFSPVLGKSRRLLQTNRSDEIIDGMLSFDDLFVWSGKIQSTNARVVADKVILVPFASLSLLELQTEETTYTEVLEVETAEGAIESSEGKITKESIPTVFGEHLYDGKRTTALVNAQTRQLAGVSPWMPTTAAFVPRRVWIIELSSKDPYYTVGKQILVVDQETMLPIYKVVYDQRSRYFKTVFGGWGFVSKGEQQLPILSFLVSVDRTASEAMAIITDNAQIFPEDSSETRQELRALMVPPENKAKKEN